MKDPPLRAIGLTTSKRELASYKQFIISEFTRLDVPGRAESLHRTANSALDDDPTFLTKLNDLDNDITRIVLSAERKCCTKKPQSKWSVELHQASLLIKYWNLMYHNRNRKLNISTQLKKIYDQLPLESQISIDIAPPEQSRAQLRAAKTAKRELYKQQQEKRLEDIERQHKIQARYTGKTEEQECKQYNQRKKDDQLFKYLRTVYPKTRGRGISSIEVPDRDAHGEPTSDPVQAVTWKTVNDPNTMTTALLERNIAHFGQSKKSPFASPLLQQEYGYHGTNSKAVQVISDKKISDQVLNDSQLHPGAKAILLKLSDGKGLPPLSDAITFDEFWQAFKKWDEKTSTSPSTRHLGHYKCLMTADGNEDQYDDDRPNPSILIQRVYYHVAMAALYSANTLDRWARSATMMLEKTPGQPRIHRLRVIHLYEADYNLLLKILWARKLVNHSHQLNQLHQAQAGSRPDHRCIDVVLRKEMNYQYSRLTRTALATVDNDAKACYDRIICNLAMMISQYHGMSNRACKFHSKTLERMRFTIRTAGGDSNQSYQHTNEHPIHGSGQGSCASPSLWLHISSILLRIHAMIAQGMTRHDVHSDTPSHISAEGFVDDISLFINHPHLHLQALDLLYEAIKQDLNLWQELLAGSGGKLELDKCFYYVLAWKFNKYGDAIPMSREDITKEYNTNIAIIDPDIHGEINLQPKEIVQEHKTLGVLKTMSGDEKAQIQALKEKSNKLASQTALGQLTRFQARRAYTSIYMPAMSYSLVATSISEADLNIVQSKALQTFLPAMGYEPTFPRAVIHGPRQFGGINLGHLYTEMCISKIEAFISHIQSGSGLGAIMLTNLNWLQLHSGLSSPILQGAPPLTYMATNWFLHLRDFLYSTQGSLVATDQWQILLERQGDVALMDKVAYHSALTPTEKRIFNNWRLYFQVSTLSDIIEPKGTKVQDMYWTIPLHGVVNKTWRTSRHKWPIQSAPSRDTWKVWRKVLRTALGIDHQGNLLHPLGDWIVPFSKSRNKWYSYLHPGLHKLFIRNADDSYMVHDMTGSSSRLISEFDIHPEDIVHTIPDACFPVQFELEADTYHVSNRIRSSIPRTPLQTTLQPHIDFDSYILTLPKWRQDLLIHWQTTSAEHLHREYLTNNAIIIASDGSYIQDTGRGSYGAVIANDSTHLMKIQGGAPGEPSLHSSFRSELYGILSASILLIEVTKFCQLHVVPGKRVQFFVDNKGAIERIQRHRAIRLHLGEFLSSDTDVELQILQEFQMLSQMGYNILPIRHVKSHQDKYAPLHMLSWEAQLNVEADRLAATMHDSTYELIEYSTFPTVKAQLRLDTTVITAQLKESIRTAYHSQDLREYYCVKFQWESDTVDQIWWDVFGTAIKKLSHADRQKIQKYNVRRLHTNNRQKFFDPTSSAICMHCDQTEDNDHILQCNHCGPHRQAQKTTWIQTILEYLSEDHTAPSIKLVIMTALTCWINKRPIPNIQDIEPNASRQLRQAYESQTAIGWDNFIRGKISHHWQAVIKTHLSRTNRPGTNAEACHWAVQLLEILWNGVLLLWDARNIEKHGEDLQSQQQQERQQLLQEAERLKLLGQDSIPADQIWFSKSYTELEQYSVYSLKAWVRNARTMIRIQGQEQKLPNQRRRRDYALRLYQQSGSAQIRYYYRRPRKQ